MNFRTQSPDFCRDRAGRRRQRRGAGRDHSERAVHGAGRLQRGRHPFDDGGLSNRPIPDVNVNLEFVPYEGLHDKTVLSQGAGGGYDVVLFDVIWPAEYAQNDVLVDVTDRISDEMKSGILPGAWTTVEYDGKTLWHAVDPRYQVSVLQQGNAEAGRDRYAAGHLGRAEGRRAEDQGCRHRRISDRLELGPGGGRDLRLHDAAERLWRRFPEGWQARVPERRRSRGAAIHGRQLRRRA